MVDRQTGEIVSDENVPRQAPFLRSAYNYDTDVASLAAGFEAPAGEESRTQQQFKAEVDINTIVERFGLTGELPNDVRVPVSADYTEAVTDYQTALNLVIAAETAFMELPAKVRERFGNDPQRLQMFVEDKDNLEEARKLGIAVPAAAPPAAPEPMLVRVVPDSPSIAPGGAQTSST